MTKEKHIIVEGECHTVVFSDETEALLAAKAAGRAAVAVDASMHGGWIPGVSYVIPDFSYASDELAELVLRRHLGLPWIIGETKRLVLREFVPEDSEQIPEEEYGEQERLFRSKELLEQYIKNQYRFYEYGVWAVVEKGTEQLAGMAGVSNPDLPRQAEEALAAAGQRRLREGGGEASPWLEIGYHIFRPYRNKGYAREAVQEAADYAREVLGVRLCALIYRDNKASRHLAEGLGMEPIIEINTGSSAGYLLYAEDQP